MFKKLITTAAITAAIASSAIALTGAANAAPMLDNGFSWKSDKPLQISDTILGAGEEFACWGCLSPDTGRPRNNFVRPHYNNGNFIDGYWRS